MCEIYIESVGLTEEAERQQILDAKILVAIYTCSYESCIWTASIRSLVLNGSVIMFKSIWY